MRTLFILLLLCSPLLAQEKGSIREYDARTRSERAIGTQHLTAPAIAAGKFWADTPDWSTYLQKQREWRIRETKKLYQWIRDTEAQVIPRGGPTASYNPKMMAQGKHRRIKELKAQILAINSTTVPYHPNTTTGAENKYKKDPNFVNLELTTHYLLRDWKIGPEKTINAVVGLVDLDKRSVTFLDEYGKKVNIPLVRLSKEDREEVKKVVK